MQFLIKMSSCFTKIIQNPATTKVLFHRSYHQKYHGMHSMGHLLQDYLVLYVNNQAVELFRRGKLIPKHRDHEILWFQMNSLAGILIKFMLNRIVVDHGNRPNNLSSSPKVVTVWIRFKRSHFSIFLGLLVQNPLEPP